jgi:hypothetical protein
MSVAEESLNFKPVVDAISNNAAKMATLLLFAQQPNEYLSKAKVAREFMNMQGDDPGWVLTRGSRGTPFSYCQRGMSPIVLDEGQTPSERSGYGMVEAYRINATGLKQGVCLSGAGLGLELDYDYASASFLLGHIASTSETDMVPSLHVRIYEQLLSQSGKGRSRTQTQRAVGETASRFMQLIPRLRDAGIVSILERYKPEDRQVTLRQPDFVNLRRGGPRVHPETHAIFHVADRLVNEGKTAMNGQEFLDAVTHDYPDHKQEVIWERLRIARANNRMRFVEFAPFESDPGQHTSLVIAPKYFKPIKAWVESIRKLETDPNYRREMSKLAMEIIRDPELMSDLMAKTHHSSAYANTLERADWQSIILKCLPPEGSIDARSLYESAKTICPPISYVHFRRLLTSLNGNGFEVDWGGAQGKMQRSIGSVSLKATT